MIESRPPGASTLSELFSACSISSSSLFTQMRTAWKVRVAGCLNLSFTGVAAATTSASSLVRVIGCSRLRSTMARAIRLAKRSSPNVFSTQAISASSAVCNHSAADWPRVGSIRISSGPSRINEKPRSASSSCGEDTPRSRRIPSILPVSSRSAT
ncbi:Uncharacterised protein [Salmonella enterica subsp. enterica]|nr:Uncharacterised protein [Salmonella enterica subsp. enterica]